jgi:hypothetical protein
MPFEWTGNTVPFVDLANHTPARFVLEQVEDDQFRLKVPFRYHPPGGPDIDVTPQALGDTDLASVPIFMSWFVSRHGRHTPAALVHDQLVTDTMPAKQRAAADRIFLQAMDALDVPPVRSRVTWAAVALATRWHTTPWGRLAILAWGLASAVGTALLIYGLASWTLWLIAATLLGPLLGAGLWGRQFWAGVIAGYALWVVALPALTSWLG